MGTLSGGVASGQSYSESERYIHALEFDPQSACAWFSLGLDGGCLSQPCLSVPRNAW